MISMFHKAIKIRFLEGTVLEVTFLSGEVIHYDMQVLFEKYPQLQALNNRELFLSGKLAGNYGIVWNDEIDIEVETIFEDGILVRKNDTSACSRVGTALSEARARKSITQLELSGLSGIDQSDISKIERGVYNPSINTLEKLANAMGMKLSILFE